MNERPAADQSPSGNREADAPVDIKLDLKAQRMTITWRDGLVSDFDLAKLRQACPCAACRMERAAAELQPKPTAAGTSLSLPILKLRGTAPRLAVTDARLVGRYAISLCWSDGHDTGIYDYAYLRQLKQCQASPQTRSS
jgi:DUF971 family protein